MSALTVHMLMADTCQAITLKYQKRTLYHIDMANLRARNQAMRALRGSVLHEGTTRTYA